jgi:hypothetical protein
MNNGATKISAGLRLRVAMILAILADLLQIAVFPLFIEGLESPVDDIFDLGMGAVLSYFLGWHWEFLPSFVAKLLPGVDLVPFGRWRLPMSIASRDESWPRWRDLKMRPRNKTRGILNSNVHCKPGCRKAG